VRPLAIGERVVVAHERHLRRGLVEAVGPTWVKVRLDQGGTVVRADLRPTLRSISDAPAVMGGESVEPGPHAPGPALHPDGGVLSPAGTGNAPAGDAPVASAAVSPSAGAS
jgi:hypothetical protein